ncbi:MAG: hypothetical protein KZQ65_09880 [Candidatus Thiodiazotropha sp. (ex Gloverina cf. vestifex)]|nr:hypothetical protein [Candidatus Thiodiazotropha sp. (ex Gloverina cf. vestifex)]
MPQQSSSLSIAHRVREALIRGAIWAFVGLLYAMLFIFFAALAAHWQLPINPVFLAGILAGTLGALIYSSMRLAVLMTVIIAPFSIFYFILASWPINLFYLLLIVSTIGAIIGALYGVFPCSPRRCQDTGWLQRRLAGFTRLPTFLQPARQHLPEHHCGFHVPNHRHPLCLDGADFH